MALGIEERASLAWVGLLRLALGALFLLGAVLKLRSGFAGPALVTQLGEWRTSGKTFSFFDRELHALVLPHAVAFARLVVAGEAVAGLSLLFGVGARAGALLAIVLGAAYFLASRQAIDVFVVLIALAVLATAGGRALGFDGAIRARRPKWFLG